jgi:catechol 2,3-dioxygenase-like lactoylglutathione lyase family enzyme
MKLVGWTDDAAVAPSCIDLADEIMKPGQAQAAGLESSIGRGFTMLNNAEIYPMLPVKNLEAAERFYEKTLGLKKLEAQPGSAVTYQSGKSTLCVYASRFAGTNRGTAAAWHVFDVEGEVEQLKGKGVTFERYDDLPGVTRRGDIHVAGDSKIAWFKDPDGNILSIENVGG